MSGRTDSQYSRYSTTADGTPTEPIPSARNLAGLQRSDRPAEYSLEPPHAALEAPSSPHGRLSLSRVVTGSPTISHAPAGTRRGHEAQAAVIRSSNGSDVSAITDLPGDTAYPSGVSAEAVTWDNAGADAAAAAPRPSVAYSESDYGNRASGTPDAGLVFPAPPASGSAGSARAPVDEDMSWLNLGGAGRI
jgi:hypothetical protein